jgi:hypothetical protein
MGTPAEPVSGWLSQEGTPCTRLLTALLEDLYGVRDLVTHYTAQGRTPPRALHRQYATDRQWISKSDERSPFSFAWVCQELGLNAEAVRRDYLSGQPVAHRPQ